jgi:hypothetical protein
MAQSGHTQFTINAVGIDDTNNTFLFMAEVVV